MSDAAVGSLAGSDDPARRVTRRISQRAENPSASCLPTYFLGLIGLDELVLNLQSQVTSGIGTLEVVMVLDNSGSMSGSKIASLRTAATALTETLFTVSQNNPNPDPIKIGLVPFAASVNVGSQYATASWMDIDGRSQIDGENFESAYTGSAFNLFDEMTNVSWAGCARARIMPYDVTDDEPTAGNPDRLFAPMSPLAPEIAAIRRVPIAAHLAMGHRTTLEAEGGGRGRRRPSLSLISAISHACAGSSHGQRLTVRRRPTRG